MQYAALSGEQQEDLGRTCLAGDGEINELVGRIFYTARGGGGRQWIINRKHVQLTDKQLVLIEI